MANEFKIKNGLLVSGSITGITESGADNSAKMASTSWVRTYVAENAGSISGTKDLQSFTATAGQTSFTITNGYTQGLIDVYLNGSFLNTSEYTATDGSAVVLTNAASVDDIVDVVKTSAFYVGTSPNARESYLYTATASQTTFAATYTPGQVDVFYNGSKLAPAEFTATNGTSVVLATAATSGDVVEIMGWLTGGGLTGTRTLTINGTTYDLTANRSWTITDTNKLSLTGGNISGSLSVGYAEAGGPYTLDVNGLGRFVGSVTVAPTANSGSINFGTSINQGILDYSAVTGLWFFNNKSEKVSTTDYFQFQADGTPILTLKKSGAATFSGALSGTSSTFSGNTETLNLFIGTSTTIGFNGAKLFMKSANTLDYNGAVFQSSSNSNSITIAHTGTIGRIGSTYGTGGTGTFTDLAFATSGIDRLTIASTGAATFSSSVQSSSLIVAGSGYFPAKIITLGGAEFSRYNANIGTNLINGSQIGLSFGTRSNNIDYDNTLNLLNGRVGIGTTAPSEKLHLAGASNNVFLNEATSGNYAINRLKNSTYTVDFGVDASGMYLDGSTGAFRYYNGSTERMRITSGGSLLVGATSNAYNERFVVKGSSSSMGVVRLENNVNQADVNHGTLMIVNTANYAIGNDASIGFALQNSANSFTDPRASIGCKTESAYGGALVFNTRLDPGTYLERLRIQGSGNVIHTAYNVGEGILWKYNANGAAYGFYNAGNSTFVLTNSGVANVGSFNMSSGNYTALSDRNKKKDFELSTLGLAEVLQLVPTMYRFKTEADDVPKHLGFIAQDVKDVIPPAYKEQMIGSEFFIGLENTAIIPVLVKAVQELKAENDQLKDILTRNNIN